MSAKDYMRLNKNNTITLNLNNYTGNAFVDVIKVRDIAQVKILSRAEAKANNRGTADVLIQSLSGELSYITRLELVSNYRYLSGRKVLIPYMKNNVRYIVNGVCNKPFVAMLLPVNMDAELKGKHIPPGNYIVAPRNPDGSINYSSMTAVTRKMFRKMFIIPNQEVIARNIGKNTLVCSRIFSRKSNRQKFLEPGRNITNIVKNKVSINKASLMDEAMNIGNATPDMQSKNTAKKQYTYTAVGVIYDQDNNMVAFKIKDTKGTVRDLSRQTVMGMCEKQLINNLELVRNDRGSAYLRGRGISLNQLPRYMA